MCTLLVFRKNHWSVIKYVWLSDNFKAIVLQDHPSEVAVSSFLFVSLFDKA